MTLRSVLFISACLMSSAAQAASIGQYNCQADAPYAVNIDGEKVSGSKINFGDAYPETAWAFRLSLEADKAEIIWPKSPIQLSGGSPSVPTSETSFFMFFISKGPCLFTEGNCGALVDVVEQQDETLKLSIKASAITRLEDGSREPLSLIINGRCTKEADSE